MTSENEAQGRELEFFLPGVREFHYNPETLTFTVGEEGNTSEYFLAEVGDIHRLDNETIDEAHDLTDPNKFPLGLAAWSTLVELPAMKKWIAGMDDKKRQEVSERVSEAMRNVWKVLDPRIAKLIPKGRYSHIAIDTNLLHDGTFILRTFGDCACLGRTPDHWLADGDISDPETVVPNTLHNTDNAASRLSLFAGAGTLAWLYSKDEDENPLDASE